MKKTTKILVTVLMIMTIIMVTTNVLAAAGTTVTPGQMTGNSSIDDSSMTQIGNDIIRVLSTAGVIISVIILIVLGIKYMMGSAEEKAEYKKTLMPYVIGAALVFAASSIATVVFNFMNSVHIP